MNFRFISRYFADNVISKYNKRTRGLGLCTDMNIIASISDENG